MDVFVVYDWDRDRRYKRLLQAWDANTMFDFQFFDVNDRRIRSDNVPVVKSALTRKIRSASHTLVIVGAEANNWHPDAEQIGFRNWLNFEIFKSKEAGNALAAVKLNRYYESPEELLGAGATWAMKFTLDGIVSALERAG